MTTRPERITSINQHNLEPWDEANQFRTLIQSSEGPLNSGLVVNSPDCISYSTLSATCIFHQVFRADIYIFPTVDDCQCICSGQSEAFEPRGNLERTYKQAISPTTTVNTSVLNHTIGRFSRLHCLKLS